MPNRTAYTEGNIYNNNSSPIEGDDGKKYCPIDSRLLIYRSDIQRLFCADCGYTPEGSDEESASKNYNNAADDNSNIFIIPLSKTRSQESLERGKRQHLQGYDRDVQSLEQRGYSVIDSYQHIHNDNSTFDSNGARGSFSNLQRNRRMYFR